MFKNTLCQLWICNKDFCFVYYIQAEIQDLNDAALMNAKEMYSSSMGNWSRDKGPYASSEEISLKHQELREEITNDFSDHLRGSNEFKEPFLTKLQQVLHTSTLSYFKVKVIFSAHERRTQKLHKRNRARQSIF